jgi:hypothetical protein
MFGLGVSDGEPYLAVLENQLNQAFPDRRWEVINTAVIGYNTVMEMEMLKEKGLKYKPNIVIIEFVFNDLALPNFIRQEESPLTFQKSFLLELLSERIVHKYADKPGSRTDQKLEELGLARAPRDEGDRRYYERDPSKVPPQYNDMVGWDSYARAMNELKNLQDQYSFDVIVLSQEPDDYDVKREALELSEELGFHVVDVGPILRQYMEQRGIKRHKGSPLTISRSDIHPSAIAHELISEELFRYLVREHLIDVQVKGSSQIAP